MTTATTTGTAPDVLARAVDVRRTFDATVALDGVSLDVPAGQLIGLLGPNGAGKSTLISLMLGLRRPTRGTVELFGGDPRDAVNRRRIGNTRAEKPGTIGSRNGRSTGPHQRLPNGLRRHHRCPRPVL